MSLMRPRPVPVLLTLSLTAALGAVPIAAQADEGEDTGKLVLVLDSSGSMKESTGGGTRIDAAKDALNQVVDRLPDEAQVGIRVFGATVENRTQQGACQDTQNVVPVGALDRGALKKAVASYKPYGETPIGSALQGAAKDLGPAQSGVSRTIVLLSDGEPNCQPDPCQVARTLAAQGIDLTINVVGLNVDAKARKALQCIARAGGGTYVDAQNSADLAQGLVKASVRDLRIFHLEGEKVTGGTTLDDSLPLTSGTYLDTSLPQDQKRYYLIDRPKNGGVLLSAVARPPKSTENWNSVLRIELTTPEGDSCASAFAQGFQVLGVTPLLTTGLVFNQLKAGASQECLDAQQLVATVLSENDPVDFQMRLQTFPEIKDADALPQPAGEPTKGPWVAKVPMPLGGATTPIVAGTSLDEAPELKSGVVYTDSLRPTELSIYKVKVDYGQAMHVSVRLDPDGQAADLLGIQGPLAEISMISPTGQGMPSLFDSDKDVNRSVFYSGDDAEVLTAGMPPLLARNLQTFNINSHAVAGEAYVVVGMARTTDPADSNFEAPLKISAQTIGEAGGEPAYAETAESKKAEKSDGSSSSADGDGGSGLMVWALGGVGVLALLGAAAYVWGRRRA